jgi:hypothetical protein
VIFVDAGVKLAPMLKVLKYLGSGIVVLVVGLVFYVNSKFTQGLEEQHPRHPELAVLVARAMPKANVEVGRRIYHVRNGCVDCHGPVMASTTRGARSGSCSPSTSRG